MKIGDAFVVLLTILFVGLKLTGHIDWSWWWVLSPMWGTILLVLIVVGGIYLWLGWCGALRRRHH